MGPFCGVALMGMTATFTSGMHCTELPLSHRADFARPPWLTTRLRFHWPSVTDTLEVLRWDVRVLISAGSQISAARGGRRPTRSR